MMANSGQSSGGLSGVLLALLVVACNKELDVAQCYPESSESGPSSGAAAPDASTDIIFPWSTSFEEGLCGYVRPMGFCYRKGIATYEIVTAPVHTGKFAVALTTYNEEGTQARCLRQGTFPTSAYYSAWFYVPSPPIESGVINLIHFSGDNAPSANGHGLWDVSLGQTSTGQFKLSVYDFITKRGRALTGDSPVPTDTWFHLVVYLKRASDATGELTLYQDDKAVLHLTGLVTDDSNWGQWLVGSYATGLSPSKATIYVDDVSITPDP